MTVPPAPLPPGHHLRAARPDDLAGVTALIAAMDVAEYGGVETDEGTVAEEWARPRFDLATDAWVVQDADGAVVAYTDVWDADPHVDFSIDPYVLPGRPRAIERTLLEVAEARAREHLPMVPPGSRPVMHTVRAGTDTEGRALLADLGWRHVRTFLRMGIDLPDDPPVPVWPAGTAPRTFRPGEDDVALHRVLEVAFADHFRAATVTLDEFREQLRVMAFAPALSFLAEDGGIPVGAVVTREEDGKGWIRELGVLPGARGRGLGLALLRHAFRLVRAAGHRRVELGVDAENASGATRLYERAGMVRTRHYDFFARSLTAG